MQEIADAVVVVDAPSQFFAIGEFYNDFSATSEDQVLERLARSRER